MCCHDNKSDEFSDVFTFKFYQQTLFIPKVSCIFIYFVVSGEIIIYLVKIKVASITREMISHLFTCD